jgi:hypothetical protein
MVFGRTTPAQARAMHERLNRTVCGVLHVRVTTSAYAGTCPRCVEIIRRAERKAAGGIWLVLPARLVLPHPREVTP